VKFFSRGIQIESTYSFTVANMLMDLYAIVLGPERRGDSISLVSDDFEVQEVVCRCEEWSAPGP